VTAPQVGYLALLRGNRGFRLLFGARLVSHLGDWFNLLAVLALLRSIGADSASAFGGILILKLLPGVLAAPAAGVLADRMPRRRLMMIADGLRALIVLGMLSAVVAPQPAVIWALVALQSVVSAFFEPARSALLPDIVSPAELTAANALGAASWSLMLTVGSALGGLFTAWLGWEAAIVVDAASYLVSLALLYRLVEPPPVERQAAVADGFQAAGRELVEGARYLRAHPRVARLALVKTGWAVAGVSTLVLTLLGEGPLALPADPVLAVSALYMARGVGTGLGPIIARWISRSEPARMERLIGVGYAFGAIFYVLVSQAGSLWLTALLVACAHLGGATVWVFSTIRLQQLLPANLRGRVFAAEQASFTTTVAVTTALYGWLHDALFVAPATLALCMGLSLAASGMAWSIWKPARCAAAPVRR